MKSFEKINSEDYSGLKVSSKQMAEVDKIVMGEFGINIFQMMELAGFQLASLCTKYLHKSGKVLVVAGSGHNGGGGLVAAKHLFNWGYNVSIFLTSTKPKPTTEHQLNILKKLTVQILAAPPKLTEFDLLVDSILGYNVKGKVKEPIKSIIDGLNSSKVPTISLDLPSGLNPDTGEPQETAVKAIATLTLAAPKVGLLKPTAKTYIGNLYLADIGIPKKVFNKI